MYGLGWRSYEAVYRLGIKRRKRFPIPILGVGNLTAGGEGKTPIVIELSRLAIGLGFEPAISMSAYGSPSASGVTVLEPQDEVDPTAHGDEPAEVRSALPKVPLILGRDRVAAAQSAVSKGFGPLILDDGFQHLPLARTADLVIWNEKLQNKRLLPAGPMREPLGGLQRASGLVCYDASPKGWNGVTFEVVRESQSLRDIATNEEFSLEWLCGRTVDLLCAIARPEQFEESVINLRANVRTRRFFPDHAPLTNFQFGDVPTIVTEKDATKLSAPPGRVYALSMRARFNDEEAVSAWLKKTLSL